MLISQGSLTRQALAGRTAVVTGAGGGIGLEAARALIWLGARVVVAEINKATGSAAAAALGREFGAETALFVHTDVGDEGSVRHLAQQAEHACGAVDIVINNATLAPLGAITMVPISDWDASYRVNLRGPVLLARAFVPGMIERKRGVFVCVSSTGADFMSVYESVKAAQVHFGAALDSELQGKNVFAFTIGPGFVPTNTAASAIPRLAVMMGKPVAELQALLRPHTLSVEAAGAGFAAAVALAERYGGQEISSQQALMDAAIAVPDENRTTSAVVLSKVECEEALVLCRRVKTTLAEQAEEWKRRSVFERQWMVRMFRQKAEMPVDEWMKTLQRIEAQLAANNGAPDATTNAPFAALARFYSQLYDLAKGYVKDMTQREAQLATVDGWRQDVTRLAALLHSA